MKSLPKVSDCVDVHGETRDAPQLVCTVARGSEVMGFVVVDSTVCGISRGGLRMSTNLSEPEIRDLARTMTLKCGFLGQPQGGAKAGVRFNPEAPLEERRQRLAEFGRAIAPILINRIYIPGPDMGTDDTDIRAMFDAVGVKLNRRELRDTQSGQYTAATVFISAKGAIQYLGLTLSRCTVAIEGFGKVGSALASLLDEANAKVVAISTERGAIVNPHGLNVKQLNQLSDRHGSRVVDLYADAERIRCPELFELPVDLLCPCATHHGLHADNAPRVLARLICSGANNPRTVEAEEILFERGLVYLPDFVTNCGGILGSTMVFASMKKEQIVSVMERHFGDRVAWLLKEARLRQVPLRKIAEPFARQRFEQIQRIAARPSLRDKLVAAGVELYARGWVPGSLVAALGNRTLQGGWLNGVWMMRVSLGDAVLPRWSKKFTASLCRVRYCSQGSSCPEVTQGENRESPGVSQWGRPMLDGRSVRRNRWAKPGTACLRVYATKPSARRCEDAPAKAGNPLGLPSEARGRHVGLLLGEKGERDHWYSEGFHVASLIKAHDRKRQR